jgi:hypothetical protein
MTAQGKDLHPMARGHRRASKRHPGVVRKPVFLARVTPTARGYDVLPGVRPSFGPWDDVVQVLGRLVAVLAATAIASEHRTAIDGNRRGVWHTNISGQAHDRRFGNLYALSSKNPIGGVDHLGLVGQNKQEGTPGRHDPERFE